MDTCSWSRESLAAAHADAISPPPQLTGSTGELFSERVTPSGQQPPPVVHAAPSKQEGEGHSHEPDQ